MVHNLNNNILTNTLLTPSQFSIKVTNLNNHSTPFKTSLCHHSHLTINIINTPISSNNNSSQLFNSLSNSTPHQLWHINNNHNNTCSKTAYLLTNNCSNNSHNKRNNSSHSNSITNNNLTTLLFLNPSNTDPPPSTNRNIISTRLLKILRTSLSPNTSILLNHPYSCNSNNSSCLLKRKTPSSPSIIRLNPCQAAHLQAPCSKRPRLKHTNHFNLNCSTHPHSLSRALALQYSKRCHRNRNTKVHTITRHLSKHPPSSSIYRAGLPRWLILRCNRFLVLAEFK
mmetsp:Transcript_20690/g.27245  ORF Transcript_20690/g.27245 Transcript_20690/m.27245 type:complete len:283 (+) Transcript_20690:602-1450(+)